MSHIVTSNVLPSDTSQLNRFFALHVMGKTLSRHFIQLDPVLQPYYELAAPITFLGDFEIEIEFATADVTSNSRGIVSDSSGNFRIYLDSVAGTMSAKLQRDTGDWYITIEGFDWSDGKLTKAKLSRVGNEFTLTCNTEVKIVNQPTALPVTFSQLGRVATFNFFDGILANPKFTDLSDPQNPVVTSFKLDNPPIETLYGYGSELVDNGGFDDGIGGWSAVYQSSIAVVEGKLRVTANGGINPYTQQIINGLVIGKAYEFRGSQSQGNSISRSYSLFCSSTPTLADSDYGISGANSVIFNFVATTTACYIKARHGNTTIGTYFEIDNISVREITNYNEVPTTKGIEYSEGNTFGGELVVNGGFDTDSD